MQPRKLNVGFFTYSYGGNGGIPSESPKIREWIVPAVAKLARDPRVGVISHKTISDTPITMSRNLSVLAARANDIDVIVMVDSDMWPDYGLYKKRPGAKEFLESSFDFLYKHYDRGPSVIAAPYGGPPPVENCYVFKLANYQSDTPDQDWRIECFSREEAGVKAGIENVAALPTGLMMADTRAFELTDPKKQFDFLINEQGLTPAEAKRRIKPWFYYDYKDVYESNKASTEDVTATRDIALMGTLKLGYSPIYCNWDAWAGHIKVKVVGPPELPSMESINDKYQDAVLQHRSEVERLVDIGVGDDTGEPPQELKSQWHGKLAESGHVKQSLNGSGVTPADHLQKCVDAVNDRLPMTQQYGDRETLLGLVREAMAATDKPPVIIEVGTWIGETAKQIADVIAPANGKLYCVDTWKGSPGDPTGGICADMPEGTIRQLFDHNTRNHRDTITPVEGRSVAVAANWKGPKADLIFIDANHDYEAVWADIEAWSVHVRPNGMLCGHDYKIKQFPGVTKAVEELVPDDTRGSMWWKRIVPEEEGPPPEVVEYWKNRLQGVVIE